MQSLVNLNKREKIYVYIDGANLKKGVEILEMSINYEKLYSWLKKKYKAEFLKRSTTKIVYIENMLDILCDTLESTKYHTVSMKTESQKEKAPSEGAPVRGSSS